MRITPQRLRLGEADTVFEQFASLLAGSNSNSGMYRNHTKNTHLVGAPSDFGVGTPHRGNTAGTEVETVAKLPQSVPEAKTRSHWLRVFSLELNP